MKKIGIIGAMEEEVNRIREKINIKRVLNKANMEFCLGELSG